MMSMGLEKIYSGYLKIENTWRIVESACKIDRGHNTFDENVKNWSRQRANTKLQWQLSNKQIQGELKTGKNEAGGLESKWNCIQKFLGRIIFLLEIF